MNKIWIELNKPETEKHGELQCLLANKMLRKLGIPRPIGFVLNVGKMQYEYVKNEEGEYYDLPNHRHYLNLDFISK